MTPSDAIKTLRLHAADYAAVEALAQLVPESGEAFFADRDEFLRYVAETVNPARESEGLETVGSGVASHLFDVVVNRRYLR